MSQNLTPPPMPGYGPPLPPPAPKKTPTVVIAVASAVAAALVAAAITAGVTTGDEARPTPTVTVTETVAEGDAASAADADSEPTAEESDDSVFALNDTVTYDSDVEVSLSGFQRAVSSSYASPANRPYLRFTAKITNSGSKTLDTTQLTINCSYGDDGHSSEPIFGTGLEGGPETRLLSGRSINVPWGCALPKNASLIQIEIAPDFDSEKAIFTGTVK